MSTLRVERVRRSAIALLVVIASLVNLRASGQRVDTDDTALRRVVDDYIGLYRKETLEQWKALFLPGFIAASTNEDGSVTTRTLDQFYERQRSGFERGAMSERLENLRVDRIGHLAHAFADFYFRSGGETRHGQLMLLLVAERGSFKIAALAFTYHL